MAKGFFKGVFWGSVFSVSAAVVAVLSDREASTTQATISDRPTTTDGSVGSDTSIAGLATQNASAPRPDTLSALASETLAPAAVPLTGNATDLDTTLQTPPKGAQIGVVPSDTEPPRVGFDTAGALQTPSTEQNLSISTVPAQPVAPDPAPATQAFDTAAPAAPKVPADVSVATNLADDGADDVATENQSASIEAALIADEPTQPPVPQLSNESSALDDPLVDQDKQADVVAKPDVVAEEQRGSDLNTPSPQLSTAPTALVDVPQQPFVPSDAPEVSAALPESEALPEKVSLADLELPDSNSGPAPAPQKASARVSVETDVADLDADTITQPMAEVLAPAISPVQETLAAQPMSVDARDETKIEVDASDPVPVPAQETSSPEANVRVNRLPNLATVEEEPPLEDEVAALDENIEDAVSVAPFDQFAANFENPEAKPVLGIVVMDTGALLGAEALVALPFVVSVAVDALLSDATERMQSYRAAGIEVLALVDLPAGAAAGDAEVNLSVALDAMPEAVAVLGGTETGVQTTPEAGRHVAQVLTQSGHGLITQNRGLNTAQKLAMRQGVPSAIVFRDLDGAGQTPDEMRRTLDQAAFRAVQDGGVVLVARLSEETIDALSQWWAQDRSSRVIIGPVSGVMKTGVSQQ